MRRKYEKKNVRERINNRRTREFEAFTYRESFNFERIKAEMIVLHNENVASKIQNVLHQANSVFERERRERERARRRERELIIAAEREENLISAVDEEERERKRERERRRQAVSK